MHIELGEYDDMKLYRIILTIKYDMLYFKL